EIERNIFSKQSRIITNFTEYDPTSIMHYPIDAEFLTDPSFAVGLNKDFSETDLNFLREKYPF
ncbi:MAG: peptidase M12, partial [Nitrososphaeraceae archaeon]